MENPLPLLSLLALGWNLREDARRLRQERVRVRINRDPEAQRRRGGQSHSIKSTGVGGEQSALRREPRRSKEASGIC